MYIYVCVYICLSSGLNTTYLYNLLSSDFSVKESVTLSRFLFQVKVYKSNVFGVGDYEQDYKQMLSFMCITYLIELCRYI